MNILEKTARIIAPDAFALAEKTIQWYYNSNSFDSDPWFGFYKIFAYQSYTSDIQKAYSASEQIVLDFESSQKHIQQLETKLFNAVETAYRRGAVSWTRTNYPEIYLEISGWPNVFQELNTFYKFEDGWNGESSIQPPSTVLYNVKHFIDSLINQEIALAPNIQLDDDGSVALSWRHAKTFCSIAFFPDNDVAVNIVVDSSINLSIEMPYDKHFDSSDLIKKVQSIENSLWFERELGVIDEL